jgi:hypothetical protein
MTTRIKLTKQDMTTRNGLQWTVGEWKETSGTGELCGPGWLHCYKTPLLAVLHNPIHACITNPLVWVVEVDGKCKKDGAFNEGWTKMRLVERAELPEVTTTQRQVYAILCALEVAPSETWRAWAHRWLSGEDRSIESAVEAAEALAEDTEAYAVEESEEDADVVPDESWIAVADEVAAEAAAAALATLAVDQADRVSAIAVARADAAWIAAKNGRRLDLVALSKKAMQYK